MDPEKETADKSMDPKQAWNLYIYLGSDSIYSLNLNPQFQSKKMTMLEKLFTLPSVVTEYPLKGLILLDSKLHCLGGVGKSPFKVHHKVFSFNLPSFAPDPISYFPSYSSYIELRPVLFTISNKLYALENTPIGYPNRKPSFQVFETEFSHSGAWKSLHPPPCHHFKTLVVLQKQKKVLLQTYDGDLIYDADAEFPDWKETNKVFPRIFAALEHQEFLFVLTRKPYKLVVYKLASFGEKDCFSRVLDIWKNRFNFCRFNIRWASLSHVGDNLICLVFITQYKIHIYVIRFMKTFVYAELEAYQEHDIPESINLSAIPHCSTFFWGPDINRHEREENPTVSQHHIKADQIEESSMGHNQAYQIKQSSMDHNQADQIKESSMDYNLDRYLYIYLGFGALLSLNFNELYKKDKPSLKTKLDLQLAFSNHNMGAKYPIGMGLLVRDSNLHFFGGENLEEYQDDNNNPPRYKDPKFLKFSGFVGLNGKVRPKYGKGWYDKDYVSSRAEYVRKCNRLISNNWSDKEVELDYEWFNKNYYSFNIPNFSSCDPLLPSHSGCKLRPLVFTISCKYYALSTGTVSLSLSSFEKVDEGKLKIFEVFEPDKNEWRHLELPSGLYEEIRHNTFHIESHCVFGDKVLLQTLTRDYVFDSVSGKWIEGAEWYPGIHAGLEYNDVLIVLTRYPAELLVYEVASFGEKDSTFGKLDMMEKKNVIDFAKHSNISNISGASLNIVDHNHISLVLITMENVIVLVFKIESPFLYAIVEAHRVFDFPQICFFDITPVSTFLLYSDAKAAGPRDEKTKLSERDRLERKEWMVFKEHLNKWVDAAQNYVVPSFVPDGVDLKKWIADNIVMPNFLPDDKNLKNLPFDISYLSL